MATVKGVIIKKEKKKDGTWNVKVRVFHKSVLRYIDTEHYVVKSQLRPDGSTIKDPIVIQQVNLTVDEYRIRIGGLGTSLQYMSTDELLHFLKGGAQSTDPDGINVIEFGRNYAIQLKAEKRNTKSANIKTVINALVDFFGLTFIPISEITSRKLKEFENFLRKERNVTRLNQYGKPVTTTNAGVSDRSLHNYMRDLRTLFNEIKDHYNDEEKGIVVVAHYPFKKYKLVKPSLTKRPKRTIEQFDAIKKVITKPGSRLEQARDLFVLSFYLCGMNARDFYELDESVCENERLDYCRRKTCEKRMDNAFISIFIPLEARSLLRKYAGKLKLRYANPSTLNKALSIGMRQIAKEINLSGLEFYDARHIFGDWARNKCRFPKDDVAQALNHTDSSNKVTDIYITKDWSIIDDVQKGVIEYSRGKKQKPKVKTTVKHFYNEIPKDVIGECVFKLRVS
jgi:integrase